PKIVEGRVNGFFKGCRHTGPAARCRAFRGLPTAVRPRAAGAAHGRAAAPGPTAPVAPYGDVQPVPGGASP
ncbi:hypothetical protein, partial [Streptomyces griseus]|uniref:hypothetical protein n=1 Tax=Streptomyces griseus TaxID=1911 RepID=UPI003665D647